MKRTTHLMLAMAAVFFLTKCTQSAPVDVTTTPTFKISEQHLKVWNEAIAQVQELSDAMPEDQYDFRPHDSVRTFAEQLHHIGGSSVVIANLFLKDTPPPQDRPDVDVNAMSKAELMEFVNGQLNLVGEIIGSMSDDQLMEGIKSFAGNDFTRLEGMMLVHDHLSNHKAKANLYVRISGNKPPNYRYY